MRWLTLEGGDPDQNEVTQNEVTQNEVTQNEVTQIRIRLECGGLDQNEDWNEVAQIGRRRPRLGGDPDQKEVTQIRMR